MITSERPQPKDPDGEPATGEPLFEHTYDGIQEYDNPMPRWWLTIFWATIVFAAIYLLNVVPIMGAGKGWHGNYADEMAAADRKFAASRAPRPAPADDALLLLSADADAQAAGKSLFMTNCMPCHRADAGGVIGPNLTDDHWLHGARPGDIHRVISAGVLDKGMPAWAAVLPPDDVTRLTAYVLSVHGTNPPNPKAPQGEEAEEPEEGGEER